ncbi:MULTISPECIES: hypothetical protein [unclassified Streptomyces]|uniref:hypothetical protein n=1 Tax=unclassified Streptomyces TaxID=2593676 RepID=UPI00381B58B6
MTTAADPRPPSPADMARTSPAARRAAERLALMLAPAPLPEGARFRPEFGRAMLTSQMGPHPRLVALTLSLYGSYATGHIPTEKQPRLHGLTRATGLHAGQVVIALRTLQDRGWISCTGSQDYTRADLRPRIPQHHMDALRQQNTTASN